MLSAIKRFFRDSPHRVCPQGGEIYYREGKKAPKGYASMGGMVCDKCGATFGGGVARWDEKFFVEQLKDKPCGK